MALAGGVGADPNGDWIASGLRAEGIVMDWFDRDPGVTTPVATVAVAQDGEPTFTFVGESLAPGVPGLAGRIEAACEACGSLYFTSNTLLESGERAVTEAARSRTLALGRPVVFDPNLRLDRWPAEQDALEAARACLPGAFLVKANRDEATRLTGQADPATAADALLEAGARAVVITLGADGAMLRSRDGTALDTPGIPVRPVDTTGAGDAVSATLLAAITLQGPTPEILARALPTAVATGARTTEVWGALVDPRD